MTNTKVIYMSELHSNNLVTVDYRRPHESGFKTFKLSDAQVSAFNCAEDVHAKLSIVYSGELVEDELVD